MWRVTKTTNIPKMLLTKLSDSSYGSYKNIVTLWIQPFSQARFNHWFLSFRRTISTRFHIFSFLFHYLGHFHILSRHGVVLKRIIWEVCITKFTFSKDNYLSILFDIIIFGDMYVLTADIFVICGDVLKRLHWAGVMWSLFLLPPHYVLLL